MGAARYVLPGLVLLGLAVTGCASSDQSQSSADASERPCTSSLCKSYEAGFAVGDKALTSREEVGLSPDQQDSLPQSDGSAQGAIKADMAVADILCDRKADDYMDTNLAADTPEHREAFATGCMDGATPLLSGKPNRYLYDD
ncbi:hypothetical protein QR77_32740 [Streptomyces sp. 150FB]|uniref:hypothetical protein n=1 Tax=Streptomyces sp. 150FB TaxID=1576605 RepID=UPI0005890424|nr:hypothetical protein [Streptomyces sp. 150FB]KIF77339.1 hypothetical protein QR77_32740 [Streptomyces sp. 150FB]